MSTEAFASPPQPPPLPEGLPHPIDDGAADHLEGQPVPRLVLPSTSGEIDLGRLADRGLVLYVFPKIGSPNERDVEGWDQIPGARGCTQQSCAFRDLEREFDQLGYSVAGLSAQPTATHSEAAERLQLAFPLIADPDLKFGAALGLPTFEVAGMTLYKRITLIASQGRIVKRFYPVFPPDENAPEVLRWIRAHAGTS